MTQSVTKTLRLSNRIVLIAAIGAALLPLGGCGLSSLTNGLGTSVFGNGSGSTPTSVNAVTEEQLLSAAKAGDSSGPVGASGMVAYGCPKVRAVPSNRDLTVYEDGRVGDGLAIMHRGEITKTARECLIERGRVTVKYGFSGRVLLGPRGKPGVVTLPVNIILTDGKSQPAGTDVVQVNVEMSLDKPIGYFSAVRTITFDIAEGTRPGEYEISLSFDRKIPGSG